MSIFRVEPHNVIAKMRSLNTTRVAATQLRQALEIPDGRCSAPHDFKDEIQEVVTYLRRKLGSTWNAVKNRTVRRSFDNTSVQADSHPSVRIHKARSELQTYVTEHSYLFDFSQDPFDDDDMEEVDILLAEDDDDA